MMRRPLILLWFGFLALPLCPTEPSEQEVKAAFLYHFAQFTEWPASSAKAGRPFLACVLGQDAISGVLRSVLRGKTLASRPVSFREQATESDLGECDLVFVAASERRRFPLLRESLANCAILTVGDWPRFAAEGGMIGFYTQDDKLRFEVNVEAVRKTGLSISSQVLRLARIVPKRRD